MKKILLLLFVLLVLAFSLSRCFRMRSSNGGGQNAASFRSVHPQDVALTPGYTIDTVVSGLTFPTDVTFDEEEKLYVIESGYSYGELFLQPRLIRIGPDGEKTIVAEGSKNGPWTAVTFHQGNFYISEGGQLEGGRILRVSPQGEIEVLLDGLPSLGDHHTNAISVGPDGYLYFGQGVATNSGVVGKDNYDFGWLKRFPDFHDQPCLDITLNGQNFETDNFLTEEKGDKEITGAFVPFGTTTTKGQVIKGAVPCSGALMRLPLDGGDPELVAWGFRNPYGLAFSADGQIYVADNSYDVRGSRPVWGAGDYLWRVEQGRWYGWPDFSGGVPLFGHGFDAPGEKDLQPLLAEYPGEPPHPPALLGVHSSSCGMDISRNPAFGFTGQAFIAQFGDMAPGVGKVLAPVGFRIVRVDLETGVVTEFAANRGKKNGPASWLGSGGLERPVSVQFGPDGAQLYVVDFGVLNTSEEGPQPRERTGVIWRISKGG